jgi:signal transduction histidine kinase
VTDAGGEAPPGAARLWLRALEGLADRAAHELRNPLNGAVLNAEVVRARAARPGIEGSALLPFAEAAAGELARAAALTEALLALARPVRVPVDLSAALSPLTALAGAVARAGGGALRVEALPVMLAPTVHGDTARGALGTLLLAALDRGGEIALRIGHASGRVTARVEAGGAAPRLPDDARATLRELGVGLEEEPDAITVSFPAD